MRKTVRTQVYVDLDQYEWLRAEAFRRRVTLSEVLREVLRQFRNGGRPASPKAVLFKMRPYLACIKGGPRDTALHHDRYAWGR